MLAGRHAVCSSYSWCSVSGCSRMCPGYRASESLVDSLLYVRAPRAERSLRHHLFTFEFQVSYRS